MNILFKEIFIKKKKGHICHHIFDPSLEQLFSYTISIYVYNNDEYTYLLRLFTEINTHTFYLYTYFKTLEDHLLRA